MIALLAVKDIVFRLEVNAEDVQVADIVDVDRRQGDGAVATRRLDDDGELRATVARLPIVGRVFRGVDAGEKVDAVASFVEWRTLRDAIPRLGEGAHSLILWETRTGVVAVDWVNPEVTDDILARVVGTSRQWLGWLSG